jgi:hypothetical protein
LVKFSGTVRDEEGKPQSGVVGITFALYKDQDGGAPLWLETQNVQADANGHYTVMLGATNSDGLPVEFFSSNEARWVGVQPQGQKEEPRVLLVSAPYALKAADAETLGGKPASAFLTTDSQSPLATAWRAAHQTTGAASLVPGASSKSSPSPASPCSVTSDGSGTVNSLSKFLNPCEVVKSSISESGGTVTLGGSGILSLPQTTSSVGIVKIGGNPFLHACCSAAADNSFVGPNAGNLTTTGNQNVASGFDALHANTSGSQNTATGYEALRSNTIGGSNTADGHEALISNTSGFNNTASGFSALLSNGTGHDNTASGDSALAGNTTGSFNTASGESALSSNTTGSFNTAFGYAAQVASSNLTNATAIGAHATVGASNALVLGGTGSNAVNVGIGTTTPIATLDVEDTASATVGVLGASSAGVVGSAFATSGVNDGVVGQVFSSSTSTAGVLGKANATSGITYGVSGFNFSDSNFAAGIEAVSDGSSGKTFGLVAVSNSLNGTGVFSEGVNESGTATGLLGCCPVGVWGDTGSNAGGAAGLIGTADDARAIFLQNNSPSGVPVEVAFNTETSFHNLTAFQTGGSFGFCSVDTDGNLTCTGAKHAVVSLANGRQVSLNAVESPENWFEDFGSGHLSHGGATVMLESTFAETVNIGMEYHVFLTPKGDCKGLYVANETAGRFEVHELGGGQSDVAFDYRIVARRKGYENLRLEDMTDRLKNVRAPMPQATPGQRLILPGPVAPAVPKQEVAAGPSASR